MKEEPTGKDILTTLIGANVPAIALLILTGWLAYLDKEWGWTLAAALVCMKVLKTSKDKFEEEKEQAIERQKLMKKYGDDLFHKVGKN